MQNIWIQANCWVNMNDMSAEPDYFNPPFLGPFALVHEGDVSLDGLGFWEQEVASGRTNCSDSIYRLVGVDPAVGRQEKDFWVRRVHPDDVAAQEEAYLRIRTRRNADAARRSIAFATRADTGPGCWRARAGWIRSAQRRDAADWVTWST